MSDSSRKRIQTGPPPEIEERVGMEILDPDDPAVCTAEEVAYYFKVERTTVYRWSHKHGLPTYKVGHRRLFKWEEVLEWYRKWTEESTERRVQAQKARKGERRQPKADAEAPEEEI